MSVGLEKIDIKSNIVESQVVGSPPAETLIGNIDGGNSIKVDGVPKKSEANKTDDGTVLESMNELKTTDIKCENEALVEKYERGDCRIEGEGHLKASDLIWGKVKSHPWWPGQIFDAADSSAKARKYSKKDGFLIAYFGDRTFAWNRASRIKPFREHFSQMEKQSKYESFCDAVDCALGEVSRRVEFGLACSCLSKEVYDKIKTQSVVSGGIRKESSRREGGDEYSRGESFSPLDLVQYVMAVAQSPSGGIDRLKAVTAQAQLLAFNRHKGFSKLPEFEVFGRSLEDDVEHIISKDHEEIPLIKIKSGIKGSSRKRKKMSNDGVSANGKSKYALSASSVKEQKADIFEIDKEMMKKRKDALLPLTGRQFSSVGASICRVIPVLKDRGSSSLLRHSLRKSEKDKVVLVNYHSPDEMLSHLCAAARDPLNGWSFLNSTISFLSDMRNLVSLENFTSREHKKSSVKSSSKQTGVETMGTSVVDGVEDSYWTDRVVESNTQEQVLFEPETPNEEGLIPAESGLEMDHNEETDGHIDNKNYEEYNPTALILNFTDIESVPTQSNLNNIFRRYGPLNELGTEVLKKSKRAKVIFKRRSDAEIAFSSSGKFSIFGPSLVSYRLHYLPSKPNQSSPAKKRSKKGANSVEGIVV